MRRAAGWLLPAVCSLFLTACAPTYRAENIEGTDLESRYPIALEEARTGLARSVAVTLVLFTGWLAGDVTRRGPGRGQQGGALLTAGVVVGVLLVGWAVVATAGPYPQGGAYKVAVDGLFWLAWATFAAGAAWMNRGLRSAPGDNGETVWGLFLVLAGLTMVPTVGYAVFGLWVCC